MRRSVRTLAVVCTVSAVGTAVAAAVPASAATASVNLERSARFVVGTSVGPASKHTFSMRDYTSVPLSLHWVSGAGAVCSYHLTATDGTVPPWTVVARGTATSLRYVGNNYDDSYGGQIYGMLRFFLTAHGCQGQTWQASTPFFAPTVIQEDGYQVSYAVPAKISYSGKWTAQRNTAYSAGAERKSTGAGAAVTLTTRTMAQGHLGLVMDTGPGYGSANVILDGKQVADVNTCRKSAQHRMITWTSGDLSAGQHTLRIVTQGGQHASVAVDAFLQD
jgi:hypothetical protein